MKLILSLAVAAALAASAAAQKPDLLGDARRMQELATQRAEADLQAALRQARNAGPAEALAILRRQLDRLEQDDHLEPARKARMVRTLKDSIDLRERTVRAGGGAPAEPRPPRAPRAEVAEAEKIRTALKHIEYLQKEGRYSAADREVQALLREFPDNPAVQILRRQGALSGLIGDVRSELKKREDGVAAALNRTNDAATPSKGDIDFDPKRWAEIEKYRKDGKLTEKERALLAALEKPVEASWRNVRFEDVIEALATATGQPISLDKKALEEQNLTYDTPVTFVSPKPVSMRTALRKVLADQGLAYIIKDGLIYVTSAAKAREEMVTKVYPIADLVSSTEFANALRYGPAVAAQSELDTAKAIVEMIKTSIDPMSWRGDGGQGTITYSPIGKMLVVRQSAENHLMLRKGLK